MGAPSQQQRTVRSPLPLRLFSTVVLATTTCLLAASLVNADPNAPCYFPRGEPALGFYPCQAYNAPISSCCPAGWTCFSNALCVATTDSNSFPNLTLGAVRRGACTNPEWNNNICGNACLDSDNKDGKLAACGDDRFCCERDFNDGQCSCSTDSDSAFTISVGLAQTIIQVSDTSFTGTPSLSIASTKRSSSVVPTRTAVTRSTSSSSPTPTAVNNTSSATAASSTRGGSTSSQTTASAPTGSSSSDTDGGSGGSSSNSSNLKIGLGVGIPLAALAVIGGLLYFLWWKPNHGSGATTTGAKSGGGGGGGGGGGADGFGPSLELAEDHAYGPTFGESYHAGGGGGRK
ncbi:hypothetical protein B0T17DRAFT_175078 [Bombardia bombarda]|uniref:Mid2 domain-containing protein n=1 Tax=Bombardia bombarda TaxID=252184 RepID=A0AA39X970_9PEZI|nr:hypothetical protein B0T17DRAFT_175078 [Bombardia bombarda]